MSVALWSAQVLLAALFIFAGVMKFVMPLQEMVKGSSLPAWFLIFVGVAEILGGIGMIVPALLRIWPVLTPVAACGLVIIMAGATVISVPMGAIALLPFSAGALAAFVAYGRWRLKPVQARA
ncbi:MAG TPA: DoxX family protein [Bryobacteraceae bacterium]|nr:DoxX family protein [Bryobacteraceae bacterium]